VHNLFLNYTNLLKPGKWNAMSRKMDLLKIFILKKNIEILIIKKSSPQLCCNKYHKWGRQLKETIRERGKEKRNK
jgi:hypothetical protein